MYDDVLVPVALGDADQSPAIGRALDLAREYGATLHVVSVVDPTVFDPLTPDNAAVEEALESSAESTVEAVAERAADAGLDVETRLGHGAPHAVVTDYVDEEGIDAVVMATHGREGLEHALLGSVTEKVVRSCDAPVLTVPLEA